MKVLLLSYTFEPEKQVAVAANLCYSNNDIEQVKEKFYDQEEQKRLINILIFNNHLSPFEHASFTFGIQNVSRSLTHQLVRHRIASYSQQSQRYVNMRNNLSYVLPLSIEKSRYKQDFIHYIEEGKELYKRMIEDGIPKEDARYLLTNATCSNIIVTMNARSLLNFFELRCCKHSQWEIRKLAFIMLSRVKKVAPILFNKAGPSCKRGFCRENDQNCNWFSKFRGDIFSP
ncbi:MAG: FAD-dependent thymidylate synthase [Exilispira sp.]